MVCQLIVDRWFGCGRICPFLLVVGGEGGVAYGVVGEGCRGERGGGGAGKAQVWKRLGGG